MLSHPAQRILLICILFVTASFAANAMPDTTAVDSLSYEAILLVDHLDFDCVPDTLVGVSQENFQFLPDRIIWGRDTAISCVDSTGVPDSLKDSVTFFTYPSWQKLRGSTAIHYYNQDSLPDIIVSFWGRVGSGQSERDTGRIIAFFGQNQLDTLDTIRVEDLDSLQSSPYYALPIRIGYELLDSSMRSSTGFPSYVLPLVSISVNDDTTSQFAILVSTTSAVKGNDLFITSVFPNPFHSITKIKVHPLPIGQYYIEIYSADGSKQYEKTVEVGSSGELYEVIKLQHFSSGTYLLRIRDDESVISTNPIAIIK